MAIQLDFINRSDDGAGSPPVVIFQKNRVAGFGELAVAWTVITGCSPGHHDPIAFPMDDTVSASDSYGNTTAERPAQAGQLLRMTMTITKGCSLSPVGPATSSREFQVVNGLQGGMNASVYKGGRLLATVPAVAPGQTARFEFGPTLWIGVAPQAVQGQVMDAATVSGIVTELSLLGVASADIVMTGGGTGSQAQPYEFQLDNVVMA